MNKNTLATIIITFFVSFIALTPSAHARNKQALKHFKERTIEYTGEEYKKETIKYRLMSPANIEKGKTYPLIVFLHGAGERGNDNGKQLYYFPERMASDADRKNFPCFILAPQCRSNKKWVEINWSDKKSSPMKDKPGDMMQSALNILDHSLQTLPIDKTSVYLTGLSMGGYGSWEMAMRRPKLFAAVVPICGGGDETSAKLIKDIPIWAWHGDKDRAVPTDRSRSMVKALKTAGGKPIYSELKGVGHGSWNNAYKPDSGLMKWMFKQKRGE
jgi:predicted peptidase